MERWRRIDEAAPAEARALLRTCCGAERWVARMMSRRPFGHARAAVAAAHDEWFVLSPEEWREAFAHHPRIGDREALRRRFPATRALSEREQSGIDEASDDVLDALAGANRDYEARFGHIFIVCATGKTAAEMLGLIRERLQNDADTELRVAAEEHARICELRLMAE
jgi:2-oxo-4-hydroxy-4-carboxy-5-ureidoimidazoline decarboxylase